MGDRRQFLKSTLSSAGIFSLSSLPFDSQAKLKILCIGGHPDDPESGCGGTLAKFAAAKHDVTIIYLTRGEAGIPGKSHTESAAIRTREAEEAARTLGAKPIFAGQIDGDTIVNEEWIGRMAKMIEGQNPDIVFTHYPLDTHKDHTAACLLTWHSWLRLDQKFQLYFFEVCAGNQTMNFHPTDYVDISDTQQVKRNAIFAHKSQDPEGIYACGHASMEDFRGREIGVKAAEAFIRAGRKLSI